MKRMLKPCLVIGIPLLLSFSAKSQNSDQNLLTPNKKQQIDTMERNKEVVNNHVSLIDKFIVPKNAVEEVMQRMKYNRNFIKTLPGFVKDEIYETHDQEGNLTIITIAVWKNQDCINHAKKAVQAEYKRIGFNPAEFYQRLKIKPERGIYQEMAY